MQVFFVYAAKIQFNNAILRQKETKKQRNTTGCAVFRKTIVLSNPEFLQFLLQNVAILDKHLTPLCSSVSTDNTYRL